MAPKSVLVCEDYQIVQDFLSCALEMHGFIVTRFSSADDAINCRCIELQSFDIVVTDFEMPGMKGDEFARYMRTLNPCSKIIITSGCHVSLESDQDHNIEFLAKPYTVAQVLKRVTDFNAPQNETAASAAR